MTVDMFNKKLQEKIDAIVRDNKPLEIAVRSIMTVKSKRIFIDGKNANGSAIGTYSKKPLYVSPNANKSLPAFKLKGKSGKTKKKNGTAYKTGYFNNWLDFKQTVGRNRIVKTVDLFLTGELLRDWSNSETQNQTQAISLAKAKRINQNHFIERIKEKNYLKTKRYGNVFGVAKIEKDQFLKVLQFEYTKALK